jgi:hypothetical protein
MLLLLSCQAHAQESQLEFAHQQLDARQQELRGASDAASCARSANEQLADQMDALKQELNATRRELDAGEVLMTLCLLIFRHCHHLAVAAASSRTVFQVHGLGTTRQQQYCDKRR